MQSDSLDLTQEFISEMMDWLMRGLLIVVAVLVAAVLLDPCFTTAAT
jgi:hypothetical protein